LFNKEQNESSDENVENGKGKQEFPAEPHELVVAEARKRPSYQDQEPAEENDFDPESRNLKQGDQETGQRKE
jgi:hypothetical protein